MNDAQQIFDALRRKYSELSDYSDEGFLKVEFDELQEILIVFKTKFVRGSKFNLTWQRTSEIDDQNATSTEIVWDEAKYAHTAGNTLSLTRLFRSSDYVSFGAIRYVPTLLLPNFLPDREGLLNEQYYFGEMDKTSTCHHLVSASGSFQLWINRDSLLIERIESKYTHFSDLDPETLEAVATHHPEFVRAWKNLTTNMLKDPGKHTIKYVPAFCS